MNELYFKIAIEEAKKAYKKNEVPVGAVIVKDNVVIAKACNNRQRKHNVLGHAEINTILKAENKIKDWRLDQCEMYVTLEPCMLCTNIIKESRIKNVYYLVKNPNIKHNSSFIQTKVCINELQEYKNILKKFFENLRN